MGEFEHDARRLTKVAERFSKIGSKPDLKEEDIAELIRRTVKYFEKRLPHMGKTVDISIAAGEGLSAPVNSELFEWVLENLVKNALDAMEDGKGSIRFAMTKEGGKMVIDVTDTGKGIDPRYHKDIFRPGFSTKKRGWGLGLSLSKRIVETYHKGKLSVLKSAPGSGTTFRIILRA